MKETDLALSLAEFSIKVRDAVKGLTSRIVWKLYGAEADYVQGEEEGGEELAFGLRRLPKSRVDWESYVLLYSAGAYQGHATGFAERKPGGGYTGRMEERREIQYIHQLLAANASSLAAQCASRHEAIAARLKLMMEEPQRTAAILFFQEYLRSIYRSVAGADAEILVEHLRDMPGSSEPEELLARWKEAEAKLKAEKRSVVYEVRDGRFFVFEKIGKKKRLVNGWIFGVPSEEGEGDDEAAPMPESSHYEREIEGAGFHLRMSRLRAEAIALLGKNGEEAVAFAAEAKSGTIEKILATIDLLHEAAETNTLDEARKPVAKAVVERMEKIAAGAAKLGRHLPAFDLSSEAIRDRLLKAQKLKRKL
jgi:hypothetical protein